MGRWIVAFALIVLASAPVAARGPETLSSEVKQHIANLEPLRGEGARQLFDGRPVLVKFFASW